MLWAADRSANEPSSSSCEPDGRVSKSDLDALVALIKPQVRNVKSSLLCARLLLLPPSSR